MGNQIPNVPHVSGDPWRFFLEHNLPGMYTLQAHFNGDISQLIHISGPIPLTLTLEVNNANITIEGTGHRICLIGGGNQVTINSSEIRLRIEGENNTLKGAGLGTALYVDHEVTIEDGLELGVRHRLTDDEGAIKDGAPQKLELKSGLEAPADLNRPSSLRCSFTPVPPPQDVENQPPADVNANDGEAPPEDIDEGKSGAASPSGSNNNLAEKRERDNEDESDEDPQSKKAKAD